MDRGRLRQLVLGRNPVALAAGAAAGLVLAVAVWWAYPSVAPYNLVPDSATDWGLLALYVGLPTLLATQEGGLLACWAVDLPPLVVNYTLSFSVVVIHAPREFTLATVLPAVLVAGVVTLLWGTLGYVFGTAARHGLHHVRGPPVSES